MKLSTLVISLASLAATSGTVLAQTCASPLPITSQGGAHGVVSGDTCTATNSLPAYGSTGSPQNEIIYSFVAQGANATISIAQTGGFSGSSASVFLMPSPCSSSTDAISLGAPGSPMPVSGLTNGATYYVIVTADPGGPNNGCGQFTASVTGTLPVELKKFSVD